MHPSRSLLLASVAVAAALFVVGCQVDRPPLRSVEADPSATPSATTPPEAEPTAVAASSRILMMGTVFWGRYLEQWSKASPAGKEYPFSGLAGFNRDDYDAWIAGLECPSVAGPDLSPEEQNALLSFNCKPRFLDEAADWFTALGLANNHTDNRGADGLAETRRNLAATGIQSFGDPDPRRVDRLCSVVTVPAQVETDGGSAAGVLPIALCGYHGVFRIPSERAIAQVAEYAGLMPTFAFPHSGLEYVATPDQIKRDLYRGLIDAGADAIFGDHPHWIQPAEAYRGRLIAYSLGNFIFDQQNDLERTRAASIDVHLEVSDDGHLDEWLALGELCAAQQGDCLADIEAAGLPEMPFTLGYGVVGSANPQQVTRPATPAERRGILARLGWADAMAGLRGKYSAF